jgi:hypothetical protein
MMWLYDLLDLLVDAPLYKTWRRSTPATLGGVVVVAGAIWVLRSVA